MREAVVATASAAAARSLGPLAGEGGEERRQPRRTRNPAVGVLKSGATRRLHAMADRGSVAPSAAAAFASAFS